MSVEAAQLIEQVELEVRSLPIERIQEVLDFIGFLKSKISSPSRPPRGSPEALLECAGIWEFEPGELDKILADIERARNIELETEPGVAK
jgi:hypothetical protein